MTKVLVDTSVWRRHFAGRLSAKHARWMDSLLEEDGTVLLHPWVVGELVLGGLSPKEESLLLLLPVANEVAHAEILGFVRHRRLARRGIGWVDVQIVASALIHTALVWTVDGNLDAVAAELDAQFLGFEQ